MSLFTLIAVVITVTAFLSYINARFLRLPSTIGVMAAALGLSVLIIVAGGLGFGVEVWAETLFEHIDFGDVLMKGMLSYLLFAGALHVDLGRLAERKWAIGSLATVGVVVSTFLIGTAFYLIARLAGLGLDYTYALLFGALISPTDPIAVLGILKRAKAPKALESTVIGESLFNDGVGVVVFTMILGFATAGQKFTLSGAVELFVVEALGGVLLGLFLGWFVYRLLKSLDDYTVEILLTLGLVSGGYALAGSLHTSGPIAMVVAGLFIGNHGRLFGMSENSRVRLDEFWELIDGILNAMLFVMIGFEVLVIDVRPAYLAIAATVIPVVLLARFASVGLTISALSLVRSYTKRTVVLLTWAGVRGGISIALALMLPASPVRDLILVVTYSVVLFSVLVQGLSIGRAVRAATGPETAEWNS